MTRRSDMMLEDIFGCSHTPETPIVENGEIIYWICRCGKKHPVVKTEEKDERS